MTDFDPDGASTDEGLFGLPAVPSPAVVVMAVPWEATVSYGRGTAAAPQAIERASHQVDLFDLEYGPVWEAGIGWAKQSGDIAKWNTEACEIAKPVVESGGEAPGMAELARRVDALAQRRDAEVMRVAEKVFDSGQIPAVIGGDHSSPRGLIQAAAKQHPGLGILHIDAHADLRDAYMGFQSSHASIMARALEEPGVGRIVGVSYRDLGRAEWQRITDSPNRIRAFTDPDIARRLSGGENWKKIVDEILESLPDYVHISFDIDGLDPSLCPNTGTPVPGGLRFREVQVLLRAVSEHRQVVSFDLCEVSPGDSGEWDANVGARLLYKLAGCALSSRARE